MPVHRLLVATLTGALLAGLGLATTPAASATGGRDEEPPLTNSAEPTIEGSGWSRETLTLRLGTWSEEPSSMGVLWRRDDGLKLANGSGGPFTIGLSSDDIGHWVHAEVSADAPCCSPYRATSEPVLVSGPVPTDPPHIRVQALEVGALGTAMPGTWIFPTPVLRYEYQWFTTRDHERVPLTTRRHYRFRPRDLGHVFQVQVRAISEDGKEGTWLGSGTPPVRARPTIRMRTVREGGGTSGLVRVDFPYPRRTVGGHSAVHLFVDDERLRTVPVRSARTLVRVPLTGPRHRVIVTCAGRAQTLTGTRIFTVRRGQVVAAR